MLIYYDFYMFIVMIECRYLASIYGKIHVIKQ